ncbi:hypothetical protein B0G76_6581 [Paraburkholderia sp. BL23I1N1]|nr:hypothetical protein B0G76_6581 [Paraburkholderia sp. BL23I1N1]
MTGGCWFSGSRESSMKRAYIFFTWLLSECLRRPVNHLAGRHFLLYIACLALDFS